jgi:hypothetical protein
LIALKRLAVCGAALMLAPSMSCATAMSLETGEIDLIDAGLTVAGHHGISDILNPGTGTGGFESTGAGGVVGTGGFSQPLGKGGSPPLGKGGTMAVGGRPSMAGATAVGGMTGAGGTKGTGGAPAGTGGMSGPPMCATNEKICGGVCAQPSPKVGCGPTGCDACTMTAPTNGYITCVSGACAFDCLSGFTKKDDKCEGPPPGSNTGSCPNSPLGCPDCGPVFGPGCCNQSKCGCSPIPWTVGILGCI